MAPARRHIGASRRKRRDDDGEDEASQVGELDDDSLSEGSVDSHQEDEEADGEVSESDEAASTTLDTDKLNGKTNGRDPSQTERDSSACPRKPGLKMTVSDTEAMLNGMKVSDDSEEISFDQMGERRDLQTGRTPSAPPTEPKRETLAARKRREHEKYVKEREQNPAFVPTRGSFFLHDKRTSEAGPNNHRPFNKGKSRPVGLIVDGNSRKYGSTSFTNDLCGCFADIYSLGTLPPSPTQAKGSGHTTSMIQLLARIQRPSRCPPPLDRSHPFRMSRPPLDLNLRIVRSPALP
jgi:hypothetical protein